MAMVNSLPRERIPVTISDGRRFLAALDPDTALLRLPANTGHGHADGEHCFACAGQADIRVQLFNLLEAARQGLRPPFRKVVVDASAVRDPPHLVAALQGKLPAQALRDHTVGRTFYLAGAA